MGERLNPLLQYSEGYGDAVQVAISERSNKGLRRCCLWCGVLGRTREGYTVG